jgi:hypothetical protein
MWTSVFKKHYCPVDLNIFTQLWITRRATLVQFLISLRVYLLWAYDGRFGSLLGPFGTGVTLGTLCSHFGHMMGIDASEDPQIGKNTHFLMVFKGFYENAVYMCTACACIGCMQHINHIYLRHTWEVYQLYMRCTVSRRVICYMLTSNR